MKINIPVQFTDAKPEVFAALMGYSFLEITLITRLQFSLFYRVRGHAQMPAPLYMLPRSE
ncbi:MAG: hypothetical protein AB7S75_06815 [Desulfococcaceae bacterium]